MEDPVLSTELLAGAVRAYDDFARRRIGQVDDPEMGVAQAYECGRRALAARAAAIQWAVPPPVAARVEALASALEAAPSGDAFEWVERFPRAVLETIERRQPAQTAADVPRRRFADVVSGAAIAGSR